MTVFVLFNICVIRVNIAGIFVETYIGKIQIRFVHRIQRLQPNFALPFENMKTKHHRQYTVNKI